MSDFPTTMLLPWAAIFAAALLAWCPRLRFASLILGLLGYGSAFVLGLLTPPAFASLAGLGIAAYAIAPGRAWPLRIAAGILFTLLGGALLLHLAPGFHNLRVLHGVPITPDAVPFTMYLNADKALIGLWLLWVLPSAVRPARWVKAALIGAAAAAGVLLISLPIAFAAGAVSFAPKWPTFGWLWLLNNLLIVALAEEALFRGWIQRGLGIGLARVGGGQWMAVAIAALLFGAAHASGGIVLAGLATLAGIGYGLAYRFGGLRAAWLAHASFDVIHFALFTYPLRAMHGG
ncbi:lysostaphin resistance A-like protein [Burkholderia sp. 22PA0106]|uniref:CPBP family intramembrane glutamic endopeptidase n=1 Tax=Burkholderia sp. 22PA0106 TaxID=3237371 RepID=UPI0039C44EC0